MQQPNISSIPVEIESLLLSRNVPRETFPALCDYVSLLQKWNQSINLIGPSTVDEIWERHVLDSVQLLEYIPSSTKTLTDFGSGAGLPGIILALISDISNVHLIESDTRKTAFLTQSSLLVSRHVHLHNERVERLIPWESDVLTARAFAPLSKLLHYTFPFMGKNSLSLFLKGSNVEKELYDAQKEWDFDYKLYPSITHKDAKIIAISRVIPRGNV